MSSPKPIAPSPSSSLPRLYYNTLSKSIPKSSSRGLSICSMPPSLPKNLECPDMRQAVVFDENSNTAPAMATRVSQFQTHLRTDSLPPVSSISPSSYISGSNCSLEAGVDEIVKIDESTHLLGKFQKTDLENGELVKELDGLKNGGNEDTQFLGGVTTRQFWILFTSILLTSFIAAFDSTIMASTHTTVTSSFKSSNSASWLSTSYLLTSTSCQPLYGRVSDNIGRKIPFMLGIFLFTVGTIWCALAQSMGSFIAGRAVCGIGSGGMISMGSIVLSDVIPIKIRGTYQSIMNLCFGTGNMLGAALGGLMADALGWRWEFGVQVPIGILCMIIAYFTIPSMEQLGQKKFSDSLKKKPFDYLGSILLITSTGLFILSLSAGGNIYPWLSLPVLLPLFTSLILFPIFLRIEAKAPIPIIPLKMFWTTSPHRELVFSNFFSCMTLNAAIFNLPLYFQAVRLESATIAGSRLVFPTLASTVGAVASGFYITHTGNLTRPLFSGAFLIFVGPVLLAFMQRDFSNLMFLLFMLPTSLGIGLNLPSTLMSLLAISFQSDQAVASSTLFMFRSLGSVLGISSSSTIVQNLLLYYLNLYLPEEKKDIVEKVRKSVHAIFDLEGHDKEMVVKAYEGTLRGCFLWTAVTGAISLILLWGLKLPRLDGVEKYREDMRREERIKGGMSEEEEEQRDRER